MIMKRLRTASLVLLILSALFSAGRAGAEKSITLTFTGDCTLGTEELTRYAADSFDSVAQAEGYSYGEIVEKQLTINI